jgi:hypothetical protein
MVLSADGEIAILRGLQALAKLGHPEAARALKVYNLHRADWKEWWRQNKGKLFNPKAQI